MGFREALFEYTSSFTGLIGVTPNPAGWSSGNPLTETGTACIFLKKLGLLNIDDAPVKAAAYSYCLPKDGFFSKLPGVKSNASHDDVIGIVAGYSTCGFLCREFLQDDIIEYGQHHWWVLSTSGKFYWDAMTKPWHYAYYMLASGNTPNILARASLAAFVVFDALFNKTNSSDKKLIWMMLETTPKTLYHRFWYWRLKNTWGNMQKVFNTYYGPNHIFTIYSGGF